MTERPVDSHQAFVSLEREVGLLLRRSRAISARLAGELHPDLDGAAYGLLALLQDAGPLRASDLVLRLGLDKSTVSRQVANLAGIKRIIDLESRVEALQARVHELLDELEDAQQRAVAAESALAAGYGYGGDLVPMRPSTSALVVWRPRGKR